MRIKIKSVLLAARWKKIFAVCAVFLALVVAITAMAHGQATSPATSVETENASLSGSVTALSDSSASDGGAVMFRANAGLRQSYHLAVISGTRTVYVSQSGGSDSNSGATETQAYATIQHAVDVSQPGDRILVGPGTYGYLSIYGKYGDATHWLSIESLNDSTHPIINVADNSGDDGVDIQQSSYVGLYGFEIEGLQTSSNTNPSGVAVFRNSQHIYVWNNNIHDFPGGGVNCFYVPAQTYGGQQLPAGSWDLVDVSFNTIHETSKYSPQDTSGISFYGAIDYTDGGTLDGHYAYRAVGNYIYDVENLADSNSGAGSFPYVTDGNGISVDSLDIPWDSSLSPYTKPGLMEANVVVGVGGRAIHVYNSINVDGFFNTSIGNLRSDSPAINNGSAFDSNITGGNVRYRGNLILPLNTPNSTDSISSYQNNIILGGTEDVPSNNIDERSVGANYFVGRPTAAGILTGLPISSFRPLNADPEPFITGMTGYQALDYQSVRGGSSVPAGALN